MVVRRGPFVITRIAAVAVSDINIPQEVYHAVFVFVLDATTLEANAVMKAIVRRDSQIGDREDNRRATEDSHLIGPKLTDQGHKEDRSKDTVDDFGCDQNEPNRHCTTQNVFGVVIPVGGWRIAHCFTSL